MQSAVIKTCSLIGISFLLAACSPAPRRPFPTVTGTVSRPTDTPAPSIAPAPTLTSLPRSVPTPTLAPTQTPVPTPSVPATVPLTATSTPTLVPTTIPTPNAEQICAAAVARGWIGIYILYLHPVPELVWDTVPHEFQVGLCNAIPAPNTPQGRYKIRLTFPAASRGPAESAAVSAELHTGLNVVTVGPWIPGFENHVTICATRAQAEAQVLYDDSPEHIFHSLQWLDGGDRTVLPIRCAGTFS